MVSIDGLVAMLKMKLCVLLMDEIDEIRVFANEIMINYGFKLYR